MDRTVTEMGADETRPPALVRVFAALTAVLILLQAFLGGRGFFVSPDLLDAHRVMGIATLVVTLGQIGVVFTMMARGRLRRTLLGMSGFILALTLIQLMLGFSARDGSGEAAAWHIFTGVLLTSAIAAYANTVFRARTA